MTLVIDATPGSATANSYNTDASIAAVADEVYPAPLAWHDTGASDQARMMVAATRWLDQLVSVGRRAHPGQALAWPRCDAPRPDAPGDFAADEIPDGIARAHALLAFHFADCAMCGVDPFQVPSDDGLTSLDLGDELRMTFAAASANREPPVRTFYQRVLRPVLGSLAWVGQAEAKR